MPKERQIPCIVQQGLAFKGGFDLLRTFADAFHPQTGCRAPERMLGANGAGAISLGQQGLNPREQVDLLARAEPLSLST